MTQENQPQQEPRVVPQQAAQSQTVNVIIAQSPKSVGTALVLSFFFGPLGMFYSTVVGAIVMIVISTVVGILTLGLGLLITQPICMVWAAVAANNRNKQIAEMARG